MIPLTKVHLDLEDETSKLGMEINEKKTKYMVTSTHEHRKNAGDLRIGNKIFKAVQSFQYLGNNISNINNNNKCIKERSCLVLISSKRDLVTFIFCLIILFLILSFLEIRAERRQKFISVEFSFATVFAFKHHVSATAKSFIPTNN